MNGNGFAIGEHGQRRFWCLLRKSHSHLISGKNQHTHITKILVTPCVVAMDMGIDQKTNLPIVQAANSSDNLLGKGCELIIYHDDTILADRQADIATTAL